ncbi:MAG: HNH endonuclease [Candidatus Rokuibacteriota bacterium]
MLAYIANTDYEWYQFLFARPDIDEVNFWRPGGHGFRALSPGGPFLFRLKAPFNAIAGVGFFVHFSVLPASFAWTAFGTKNGAASETDMRARVETYRRRFGKPLDAAANYKIGCVIITETTFFPRADWIREPNDWRPNIVAGRTEDLAAGEGRRIWEEVIARLHGQRVIETVADSARYGPEVVVRPRLGQGAFRILVTDTYDRRCALTGERTLPVLDAAHIRPYASGGIHAVSNGLLLRSDLHTLFDRGYLTITPEHHVEVSRRIREEFENGRDYYALHGSPLRVPGAAEHQPDPSGLLWHNVNVFRS